MNNFLKRYLDRYSLEQHLIIALSLGLAFRLLASYFIYTPIALDDLGHSWLQAVNLSKGLPMQLPEYRTPLFPYLLFFFIKIASLLGLDKDPINKVYAMNIGLGLLSLLAIIGAYYYCKASKTSNKYFSILMYLVSIYALMPLISTRAGGECFCISFLMLGLGLLKNNKVFLAFIFLGIAVLFRYQLGLIYLFYGIYGFKRKHILYAGIIGVCLLFIEAGKDLLYGRHAFETLLAYIAENQKPYIKSAWYNLILFTLALCAFPFSCILANKTKKVFLQHKEAVISIIIIVTTHSMVPHKEERFMLPVLPFLFIFLAGLWSESADNRYAQKIFSPVFIGANTIFLLITTFMPSQTGLIDPLLAANKALSPGDSLVINEGFSKWAYGVYLRDDLEQLDYNPGSKLIINNKINKIFILAASEDKIVVPDKFSCDKIIKHSSPSDKVLYKLNPKFNKRKNPTVSVFCTRD